jgi:hypothetical protein
MSDFRCALLVALLAPPVAASAGDPNPQTNSPTSVQISFSDLASQGFTSCWEGAFETAKDFAETSNSLSRGASSESYNRRSKANEVKINETYTFCHKERGTGGGALIVGGKPVPLRQDSYSALYGQWGGGASQKVELLIQLDEVRKDAKIWLYREVKPRRYSVRLMEGPVKKVL